MKRHHIVGTFVYLCRFMVTCGHDGDVRIWEGLDDDDPKFITVGEKVYSLALKVGDNGGGSHSSLKEPVPGTDGPSTRRTGSW